MPPRRPSAPPRGTEFRMGSRWAIAFLVATWLAIAGNAVLRSLARRVLALATTRVLAAPAAPARRTRPRDRHPRGITRGAVDPRPAGCRGRGRRRDRGARSGRLPPEAPRRGPDRGRDRGGHDRRRHRPASRRPRVDRARRGTHDRVDRVDHQRVPATRSRRRPGHGDRRTRGGGDVRCGRGRWQRRGGGHLRGPRGRVPGPARVQRAAGVDGARAVGRELRRLRPGGRGGRVQTRSGHARRPDGPGAPPGTPRPRPRLRHVLPAVARGSARTVAIPTTSSIASCAAAGPATRPWRR